MSGISTKDMAAPKIKKNNYRLVHNIIFLSKADSWDGAKVEWKRDDIYIDENYDTCLCGHYPIKEVIVLKNVFTKNIAIIGNCCINKFFTKKYNKLFKALRQKKLNELLIEKSYEKGFINSKEYHFLISVWRKRKFTKKQLDWFNHLKMRIIQKWVKS